MKTKTDRLAIRENLPLRQMRAFRPGAGGTVPMRRSLTGVTLALATLLLALWQSAPDPLMGAAGRDYGHQIFHDQIGLSLPAADRHNGAQWQQPSPVSNGQNASPELSFSPQRLRLLGGRLMAGLQQYENGQVNSPVHSLKLRRLFPFHHFW